VGAEQRPAASPQTIARRRYDAVSHRADADLLTGAEAVTLLAVSHGCRYAVAYPGTSELALCDAFARSDVIELVNGRGDKESVFVAAGANIFEPRTAVAILHGARGLTNALGAIADVRRNEIPLLCLVGMASTSSSRYLPPHEEPGLIAAAGHFSKGAVEIRDRPSSLSTSADERLVRNHVSQLVDAFADTLAPPRGPVLVGVSQDLLERTWIPASLIADAASSLSVSPSTSQPPDVGPAVELIAQSTRIVVLVDDLAFRSRAAKRELLRLAEAVAAPVFQIDYRRGPMLFERVHACESPNYVGPYEPDNADHRHIFKSADLIITVEDRNATPRVLGALPFCKKIAITSHPAMTRKNGYLLPSDVVLPGDVAATLRAILAAVGAQRQRPSAHSRERVSTADAMATEPSPNRPFVRRRLVGILSKAIAVDPNPVLVDDSQMFGRILWEGYDALPSGIRVFGDHGGFVGAGLAYAVGAALGRRGRVWCTLGDQGFCNAIQTLACAAEQRVPVVFVVCNNGASVSLSKQLTSDQHEGLPPACLALRNVQGLDYCAVARAFGIRGIRVDLEGTPDDERMVESRVEAALVEALAVDGPTVLELRIDSEPDTWRGIWSTKGFDEIDPCRSGDSVPVGVPIDTSTRKRSTPLT
jgi:acetolactate synthase-1/2/3 large subunit